MLIDLFSHANEVTFNSTIARTFGINSAIYLSEILNQVFESKREYIIIDRDKIANRTTLCIDEQLNQQKNLKTFNIIIENDIGEIKVDISVIASIIESNDEKLIKNVSNLAKKSIKRTKDEVVLDRVQAYIKTTNPELRSAYCRWLEGVQTKDGYVTQACVEVAQNIVDNYSNHDLQKALELVNTAAVHGYRDMNWAIELISKSKPQKTTVKTTVLEPNRKLGNIPF